MKTLPEKWCIKRTPETDKIITQYINKISRVDHRLNNKHHPYILSESANTDHLSRNRVSDGYTEITFEEFKKYVLKEEVYENIEGSVFEIGDEVTIINPKSNLYGEKLIITEFSKHTTNNTDYIQAHIKNGPHNKINIDNLQHYIEDFNYTEPFKKTERKLMFSKPEQNGRKSAVIIKEDIVYYMENESIFPRFRNIALEKGGLHFESYDECKDYYSKLEKPEEVWNKIISFRNNTGTGGIYTIKASTNLYHSNISNARIPFTGCIDRYPIHSVYNTDRNMLTFGDIVKRVGSRFKKKYRIMFFEQDLKNNAILAKCKPLNKKVRVVQKPVLIKIDNPVWIKIDNLEHKL